MSNFPMATYFHGKNPVYIHSLSPTSTMAPLNHKPLLFSLFSLVLFASVANAICVPHNITAAASPFASPMPAQTPLYGHISAAPISQPPESAAPVSQPPVSAAQAPSNSLLQIPADAEATIDKICKSTDYPDVCLAAVLQRQN
ncbi:uncharacterized protein LOC130759699 [Actinidia eriantha]|uniref:uncharacterized protein LOC130759699 n=1 Tax=Actinidia eriantha TaxID=165200 RepID=UPI002583906D|nr:uncharacterized protein LOC130759699 [Actinidia eriantha]